MKNKQTELFSGMGNKRIVAFRHDSRLIVLFLLCWLLLPSLWAESVRLAWDPNSEGNVAGYHIYRGLATGGPYSRLDAVLLVSCNYSDDNAETGQTYYYVVTAVNTAGAESAYSKELHITTGKFDLIPQSPTVIVLTTPGMEAKAGQLVVLSGSVYNPDNKSLTFLWTQTTGPNVPISGKTRMEASFMAPSLAQDTLFNFTLTMTDAGGFTASNSLQVMVRKK